MSAYNQYNPYQYSQTYGSYQQQYPAYQMQQPQYQNNQQALPGQMSGTSTQVQQQPPQMQQPQIRNGGFVSVRGIEEAQNYSVAPGNSIAFIDENAPYVYTKTMGFSQLDRPVFEKYRLVKEEDVPKEEPQANVPRETEKQPDYALKSDLESLYNQLDLLRNELDFLKKSKKAVPKKKQETVVEVKEELKEVEENE